MPLPNQVTVDGPAGSGKSSVCFRVARDMGYLFVDTGAFYRMITLLALDAGQIDANAETIVALAAASTMDLTPPLIDDGRQYTAWLDGRDVTQSIRTPQVERYVSPISAIPSVRALVNDQQREVVRRGSIIMAGRDIGTVVLPDADLKIYLDASPEARGRRRYNQIIESGRAADLNAIIDELRARDAYDSTRMVAPLRRPADAIYIDSSAQSLDDVCTLIIGLIKDWKPTPQRISG